MTLYCGIDLHSNNCFVSVINDKDQRLLEKRLANDPALIIGTLKRYRSRLKAVAVESTFNWYWLVDSLQDAGFVVQLVNTAQVVQYEGLKRTDDRYDAFHLAHLMRLGILPTGYICPREWRGLRDLLRRRQFLVQDRSKHILSLKGQYQRHTGQTLSTNELKARRFVLPVVGDDNVQLGMVSQLAIIRALTAQIRQVESVVRHQVTPLPAFERLKSAAGIGDILAQTILLETGDIKRFKRVGNYASYARSVESKRISNGKKKGQGNQKNGNKYLGWAFVEAAHCARRHDPGARAFYERKKAARNTVVATKALAHKLSRACYHIMKEGVTFDSDKLYA